MTRDALRRIIDELEAAYHADDPGWEEPEDVAYENDCYTLTDAQLEGWPETRIDL